MFKPNLIPSDGIGKCGSESENVVWCDWVGKLPKYDMIWWCMPQAKATYTQFMSPEHTNWMQAFSFVQEGLKHYLHNFARLSFHKYFKSKLLN